MTRALRRELARTALARCGRVASRRRLAALAADFDRRAREAATSSLTPGWAAYLGRRAEIDAEIQRLEQGEG